MNLTTATPVEIDTVLAEIWGRIGTIEVRIMDARRAIREANKMARYGGLQRIPALEARIEELQAQVAVIEVECEPYEAEFTRRGGWTRAFLVMTNGSGHVHSSRSCGTCYITTQYAWMIDFSGKDEAEIVDAAGERACTVCYPSAPVNVLAQPTRMFTQDEIAKQAVREEKAAKAAAKDAAKVVHPETGKVVGNTERGVNNEIMSTLDSYFWYGDHPSNNEWLAGVQVLVEALAARQGRDVAEVSAEYFAKAEAKDLKKKAKIVKELRANPNTNWDHVMNSVRKVAGLPELADHR